MRDDVFVPRDVTIAVAEIVWRNTGAVIHTPTAANGLFDSRDVPAGGTFQFQYNNVAPGTYICYCKYHGTPTGQGMAGTITGPAGRGTPPGERLVRPPAGRLPAPGDPRRGGTFLSARAVLDG